MTKGCSTAQKFKACTFCKRRKIKCDAFKEQPCSNCDRLGQTCVISYDKRTNRPRNEDVQILHDRIAQLEKYISSMNQKQLIEREDSSGNSSGVGEGEEGKNVGEVIKYPKPRMFQTLYKNGNNKVKKVYGPTSIIETMKEQKFKGDCGYDYDYDYAYDYDYDYDYGIEEPIIIPRLYIINRDQKIIEYIKIFFQKNYPDLNIFIPRETFLIEFYHPKEEGESVYCSIELIYAICSIGSMICKDMKESLKYFQISKKLLFEKLQTKSTTSIAIMQTFLLLSSYAFLRQDFTSCWMLSGIGIRMGFNLGFDNTFKDEYKISILFKSRIYWGCFIYDYFISLVFGRPTILKINDSTITESEKVPDLEWIKEFNFAKREDIIDVSNPLKSIIRLIVTSEEEIRKILKLGAKTDYKETTILEEGLETELQMFIKKAEKWREELDDGLKWDNMDMEQSPTIIMIHVNYYYIMVLSVLKSFVAGIPWVRQVAVAHAREVVGSGAGGGSGSGGGGASLLVRVAHAVASHVLDVAGKLAPVTCVPVSVPPPPPPPPPPHVSHNNVSCCDAPALFSVWEPWMSELYELYEP